MILIDYVPGSHGQFLAFVCNRFLTDLPRELLGDSPFTGYGTSHAPAQTYWDSWVFRSSHFYSGSNQFGIKLDQWHGTVIKIDFEQADLHVLTATSFLRVADAGVYVDQLHQDTYHKLNNEMWQPTLQQLQQLSVDNLVQSVQRVRDRTWPTVACWQDWDQMPQHIKIECEHLHHLTLWRFDAEHPDCPRWVLREYFRRSFDASNDNGIMGLLDRMQYPDQAKVFVFHFRDFYHTDEFIKAVDQLSDWLEMPVRDREEIRQLHRDFLARHHYRDMRARCDLALYKWTQNQDHDISTLDVIEQGWLECQIERITGRRFRQDCVECWTSLDEIRKSLA